METTKFRPTHGRQSGYFSIQVEGTIEANASNVFGVILNLGNYENWCTYATRAVKNTPGHIQAGDTIMFRIHLNPNEKGVDTMDNVLLVEDAALRKRFILASSPLPQWLLWAEKVQEIEHISENQCHFRIYISMGGPIAPLARDEKRRLDSKRFHETASESDEEYDPASTDSNKRPHHDSHSQVEEIPLGSDEDIDPLDFSQRVPLHHNQYPTSQEIIDDDEKSEPARLFSMNPKTKEDLLAKTVRYLLYKANSTTPIKLGDLTKDVFKDHRNITRHFLSLASKKLESTFGYKVISVDDYSAGAPKKDLYIVINAISDQTHLIKALKYQGKKERGLLMMILAFIWCAPSRHLPEDQLWKNLNLVDKSIVNQKHPYFGDLTLLVKTFESQLYLASESEIDGDGKRIRSFVFGPRTYAEIGKANILTFLCKIVNGRHPSKELLEELQHEKAQG